MEIKETVHPVGDIVKDDNLEKFIEAMVAVWDENKVVPHWWQFWKKVNFHKIANFLINCLDDLISYFIAHNIPGADKKATVLHVLGRVYDVIIVGVMPLYLKPFSLAIRSFILNVVVSSAIDWIVDKYAKGEWRPKPEEQVVAQWVQLHAQIFGVPGDHRPKVG